MVRPLSYRVPGLRDPIETTADLCVLHLGDGYAVVDKPTLVRAVPGRGEDKLDSIESRVRAVFTIPTEPVAIHRLDIETSGLMVVALTRVCHRALSRQFMHRKVGKSYDAVLVGEVAGDEGAVDLPLVVDWPNRPRQMVDPDRGKPARTLWRVTDRSTMRGEPVTRVSFRPVTGRTHQLRVHASIPAEHGGLGCPVAGDTLYGDPATADRLLLHASHLAFWEPGTGVWMNFDSPAPF